MSKYEKLLKDLENNSNNVRFKVLEKILLRNGFVLRSIHGSHYNHTNGKELITLPNQTDEIFLC